MLNFNVTINGKKSKNVFNIKFAKYLQNHKMKKRSRKAQEICGRRFPEFFNAQTGRLDSRDQFSGMEVNNNELDSISEITIIKA